MKKDLNYEEALPLLEAIVQDLENGNIPLDKLAEKVAVANELIAICQNKLRGIEYNVNEIISKS